MVFKVLFAAFFLSLIYSLIEHSRSAKKRRKQKKRKPKIKVDYTQYNKSNNLYCVYDIRSRGMSYYGVTHNFEARRASHLMNLMNKSHDNYLLQKEYEMGRIHEKSFFIHHDNLSRSEAYNMEFILRPRPNMGLNIIAGGDSIK